MHQEAEAAIIPLGNRAVHRSQYQSMNPIKKVYVEMVRQIVESEAENDEDAE